MNLTVSAKIYVDVALSRGRVAVGVRERQTIA